MSTPREPALGFIFVTLCLIIMGFAILIPVLPQFVVKFEGGDVSSGAHWYGILISSYSLMQFVAAPILGSLSDRFGRRRVLLIALAGSAIDYLIMGLAPGIGWLFVARVISGLTAGALATCNAYIIDVTPPERRAAGFGIVGAAFGVGFVLGPAIGGILGKFDIRLPFFVASGLVGLNWLYGAFVLPESLPLSKRRDFSWKRANPVGSLMALRRFRGVADLAWMYLVFWFAQVMLQSVWTLYTTHRYEWTPLGVGVSLALTGIMAALVQGRLVKPILGQVGERRGLILGLLVSVVAFTAYGLVPAGWMMFPVIVIGGFGGLAGPATQALITRHVPADEQGAVQGSLAGLQSLASIFAPMLATQTFAYFISSRAPLYLPGVAFFEGSALLLVAMGFAYAAFRAEDRMKVSEACL